MPYFSDTPKKSKSAVSKFIKIVSGQPVLLQVIDDDSVVKYQHWIETSDKKRVPVECSGYETCPICINNRSLGENYKDNPKYNPMKKNYSINVVDLTMVKKSPNGEVFMGFKAADGNFTYPEADSEGNSLLAIKPEPLKQVRVLSRGPELFRQLQSYAQISPDPANPEKKYKITEFPIQLTIDIKSRNDVSYTIVPLIGSALTINRKDYEDQKVDLTAHSIFTPEEVQAMLDGVAYSDIISAKSAERQLAFPDMKPLVY